MIRTHIAVAVILLSAGCAVAQTPPAMPSAEEMAGRRAAAEKQQRAAQEQQRIAAEAYGQAAGDALTREVQLRAQIIALSAQLAAETKRAEDVEAKLTKP